MGSGDEERGVARTLARGYAQGLFFHAVREAEQFVQRAQAGGEAGQPNHAGLTSFDALLGKTLVRRGLLTAARYKECCEYMQNAAWLPDPVPLREVVERRGYVPRTKLYETVADVVKDVWDTNRAYGETAVRLGYVTVEQMQECLAEVDPSKATFRLPRIFEKRGLIDKAQHNRIAAELKEEVNHHHLEGPPASGA